MVTSSSLLTITRGLKVQRIFCRIRKQEANSLYFSIRVHSLLYFASCMHSLTYRQWSNVIDIYIHGMKKCRENYFWFPPCAASLHVKANYFSWWSSKDSYILEIWLFRNFLFSHLKYNVNEFFAYVCFVRIRAANSLASGYVAFFNTYAHSHKVFLLNALPPTCTTRNLVFLCAKSRLRNFLTIHMGLFT